MGTTALVTAKAALEVDAPPRPVLEVRLSKFACGAHGDLHLQNLHNSRTNEFCSQKVLETMLEVTVLGDLDHVIPEL